MQVYQYVKRKTYQFDYKLLPSQPLRKMRISFCRRLKKVKNSTIFCHELQFTKRVIVKALPEAAPNEKHHRLDLQSLAYNAFNKEIPPALLQRGNGYGRITTTASSIVRKGKSFLLLEGLRGAFPSEGLGEVLSRRVGEMHSDCNDSKALFIRYLRTFNFTNFINF